MTYYGILVEHQCSFTTSLIQLFRRNADEALFEDYVGASLEGVLDATMAVKKFEKIREKEWRREREDRGLQPETKRALTIIFLLALGALSVLSFFHAAGPVGDTWRLFLATFFGRVDVVAPLILIAVGLHAWFPERLYVRRGQWWGVALLTLALAGLFHLRVPAEDALAVIGDERGGGYAGLLIAYPLRQTAGVWGALTILFAAALAGLVLVFETSLTGLLAPTQWGYALLARITARWRSLTAALGSRFLPRLRARLDAREDDIEFAREDIADQEESAHTHGEPLDRSGETEEMPDAAFPAAAEERRPPVQRPLFPAARRRAKVEVPLELLTAKAGKPTAGDIEANKETIQKTFANFGIDVDMGDVAVGPTVTQYTLRPAEGVKLAQIVSLANDLALSLAAHPIRIEAPIPGKSLVGIEVPNQQVAIVPLREVLGSDEFKRRASNLSIAVGKDVAGKPWIADLAKMPHLLIAGATGSGKSVMINSLLVSLLYQNQPEDMQLILVDPKRVELTAYNAIPHLRTPVITQVDRTIQALRWVVEEMDRRFITLSEAGKRNIEAYNADGRARMPYLVVVVDELADLMSIAAAEVEAAIIRLAQMARAVGIHLVLATQRPSVDIITGLIKANITARIAFAVASAVDSRTILDVTGAEKLVGRGDLLFVTAELSKPRRLQGAYVSDEEIERVAAYWREKGGAPQHDEDITARAAPGSEGYAAEGDGDARLDEARNLVVRAGKASASFLQRRMSVGYARAARLLDLLEEEGTIGPGDGAKPRDVLRTMDDLLVRAHPRTDGEEEPMVGEDEDASPEGGMPSRGAPQEV